MKMLLIGLLTLTTLNAFAIDAETKNKIHDYNYCVAEVEIQHNDDKEISKEEYNDMIIECAYEAGYRVNVSDLKM